MDISKKGRSKTVYLLEHCIEILRENKKGFICEHLSGKF